MKKRINVMLLWLLVAVLMFVCACKPVEQETDYTDMTVRSASGTNGVVTAGSPYAAKAGLDILEAGGNAYDAAVAVGFALGVAEPYASGLGGGGQMVGYDAAHNKVVFYNFPGIAPKNAHTDYTAEGVKILEDYQSDMKTGVTSCGLPMEVSGLLDILEDLGSGEVSRADVLAPAISLAENGFPVTETVQGNLASAYDSFITRSKEAGQGAARAIYGNGFRAWREGETLKNADYAKVLKSVADNGKEGFYTGWVAEAIVDAMNNQRRENNKPGLITMEDLLYAMNEYVICDPDFGPLHSEYTPYGSGDKYDVYTASLGGGGVTLVETLNMMEYYCNSNEKSLSSMGHNSAEYLHVLAQSMHFAYSDKKKYLGDARQIDVPLEGLCSKLYAAARFDSVFNPDDTFRQTSSYDFGGYNGTDPWAYQSAAPTALYAGEEQRDYPGTTSYSVCDKYGNVVCVTKTLNTYWGSFVMPEGTGFFLNNGLTNFSIADTSNNQVGSYKQSAGYISPTIVMKDGVPFMAVGSPGSEKIPLVQLQVFLNVAEFGMSMQEAIDASRIINYTVSVHDFDEIEGVSYKDKKLLEAETDNISAAVIAALEGKNYYISPNSHLGAVQAILFNYGADGNPTGYSGGADARRGGKALAY